MSDSLTRLHYRGIVLVYPVGRFDGRRLTMDVYSIKISFLQLQIWITTITVDFTLNLL